MADTDPLHAMPVAEITIRYSLGDDGNSNVSVGHDGTDDRITLLGMLEMAKDTIMRPEYDEERDHG